MAVRLGILGGTFDPIHCGHLLLARYVLEALGLAQVLFVPAADPPHKSAGVTAAALRLQMVQLAVDGLDRFAVSRSELERRGPSYTVDTLRQLRAAHPDDELVLIIGADNVGELATWHDPAGIFALATVVAGTRGRGTPPLDDALAARIRRVDTPLFDVSSTEVRRRVRAGLSIHCLVPEAVERYIRDHHLYEAP